MARNAAFLEEGFWVEAVVPMVPFAFVASSKITMTGASLNGVAMRCSGL